MGDFAYSVHGASGSSSGSGNGNGNGSLSGTAGAGAGGSASIASGMLSSTTTSSPAEMTLGNAGPIQGSSAAHGNSGGDVTTVNHQHGHPHQLAGSAAQGTSSRTSNLWGYSAPSPPGTATATSSAAGGAPAPAARLGNSVAGSHLQQHAIGAHTSAGPPPAPSAMYNSNNPGFHGYNTGNTRPMTAPSSTPNGPLYYHQGTYGPMFSPATYNGAGFPSNFGGARAGPSTHQMSYATSARQGHPLSGVPEDPHRPPGTAGSTSDLFAHHPPPLQSTSAHPGYAQSFPHGHQPQRPGTDYGRRDDQYRPGTTDTLRPDTAISTYSDYSTSGFGHPPGLSAAIGNGGGGGVLHPMAMHHAHAAPQPSYYHLASNPAAGHMAAYSGHNPQTHQQPSQHYHLQHAAAHSDPSQVDKYSFVPLPAQPKKRPRRRFEEIERIYDCNYPGCNKAYGTLNHLNAHVSMQKHGPKRVPAEFKEIRKAWRQRKKESEAKAALAAQRGEVDEEDEEVEGGDGQPANGHVGHPAYQQHPQHDPRHGHPVQQGPHIPSLPPDLKQQVSTYPGPPGVGNSHIGHPEVHQAPPSPSFAFLPQQSHPYQTTSGLHSSDGYYYAASEQQNHPGRPSTAPGNFLYNAYGPGGSSSLPSSVNGTPVFASSVGSGSAGTSPMLGGMPAGFNPSLRKQSITSLPPAFASIQEESAVEAAASAAEGEGDLVASAFANLENQIDEVDGFAREVPSFEPFKHEGSNSSANPTPPPLPLEPRSLPNQSDTVFHYHQQFSDAHDGVPGVIVQQRPSTASSPFRFSTGGFAEGAFDTLGRRRKSIASPISVGNSSFAGVGEINLANGLAAPPDGPGGRSDASASPNSGVDLTGRWSPGWSNLAAYKQEIR